MVLMVETAGLTQLEQFLLKEVRVGDLTELLLLEELLQVV